MSKMLDVLLNKMDQNVTGDPRYRLYRKREDWEYLEEGDDWASCSEEDAGIHGDIFLVRDLIKNLTWPESLYSYRSRHGYPKIKDMNEDQIKDLFVEWLDHWKFNETSPFGCGSDQVWNYEFFEMNGKKYLFTYGYMGS